MSRIVDRAPAMALAAGVAAFCVLSFTFAIGSLAIPAMALVGLLLLLCDPIRAIDGAMRSLLLLVLPLFALSSLLWSPSPTKTILQATLFLLCTAVAILVAAQLRPSRVVLAIWISSLIYVIVALSIGTSSGGSLVLAGSKNIVAFIASLVILCGLGIACADEWRGLRMIALASLVVGIVALVLSRSATATVATPIAGVVIVVLILTGKANRNEAFAIFAIGAVALLTILASMSLLAAYQNEFLGDVLGKDSTLTGRTALWETAHQYIGDRPVLGLGFQSFWQQGMPAAESLWTRNHIAGRMGFNFHNTYLEITLGLGYVGLALMLATLAIVALGLFRARLQGSPAAFSVLIGLLVYLLIRSPVETILMLPMDFATLLYYVIGATALVAWRGPVAPGRGAANVATGQRAANVAGSRQAAIRRIT